MKRIAKRVLVILVTIVTSIICFAVILAGVAYAMVFGNEFLAIMQTGLNLETIRLLVFAGTSIAIVIGAIGIMFALVEWVIDVFMYQD